jgi:hypothetical protein
LVEGIPITDFEFQLAMQRTNKVSALLYLNKEIYPELYRDAEYWDIAAQDIPIDSFNNDITPNNTQDSDTTPNNTQDSDITPNSSPNRSSS